MKKHWNITLAIALVALVTSHASAGVDPIGACYTVDTAGFTINCQGDMTEAACAALLNGVWDEGHMCNDVNGDGIIDPFITYNQIDPVAYGDCGEFTISGATLFADFFGLRATTNDFSNVDGDVVPCDGTEFKSFKDTDCDTFADGVDQLAPDYFCGLNWHGCWLAQYRSVGSGNGFAEFVNYQLTGMIPGGIPSEAGILNRARWADAGVNVGISSCAADCFPEADMGDMNGDTITDGRDIELWVSACLSEDGIPAGMAIKGDLDGDELITVDGDLARFVGCILGGGCASAVEPGTPYCYSAIDGANLDVPSRWFVTIDGAGAWNRKPTAAGYGNSLVGASDTGYSNQLESLSAGGSSLNFNTIPDVDTITDTIVAYSPVTPIANQGTGYENVTYTDLQYMLVTGRNSTGENIQSCTRDAGSGTRNAHNNSLGVDPSWGLGDNLAPLKRNGAGDRARENSETNIGYNTYTANCGGSSIMENAVRHHRLAVGYTGLFGSSRSAADAAAGIYELLNVRKDIAGGVVFVRPSVDAVINTADVDAGFSIGGLQSVVTRGDPKQTNPAAPDYMDNRALAAYLNNISDSIDSFVASSGASEEFNMPVEQLTQRFVLPQAVTAVPPLTDPTDYSQGNAIGFNAGVSAETIASQVTFVPAFGSVRPYGNVPVRNAIGTIPVSRGPFEFAEPAAYTDGSTTGAYRAFDGSLTLIGGTQLGPRMHIQGDFNVNGERDLGDITPLIAAVADPAAFQANDIATSGIADVTPIDFIVPEILGDFDGNGDLNKEDVRYFADGLAMVAGKLDRKQGFAAVDTAFGGNYFNTTLARGTYDDGDSRADVAGDVVYPGAYPNGADGNIDADDIDYVCANMFSAAWGSDLNDHAGRDLSCDMTGDCIVNYDDICEIMAILETTAGDINLDGVVNDGAAVNANIGMANPKWSDGDVDCDGDIDADDVAIANGSVDPCI